jgi:hypothetical protein
LTFAVDAQIKQIARNLPNHRLSSEKAERRRQAFLGHQTELPLKLRIWDFYNDCKIYHEEDDFQTFINSLPISTICREARFHAGYFCRTNIVHMALEYIPVDAKSIKAFKEDPELVSLRAQFASPKAETLERFYAEPTTVTVRAGMRAFRSPEHLAQILNRFFGKKVERLILDFWGDSDARHGPFWGDDDDDDDRMGELPDLYVTISFLENCRSANSGLVIVFLCSTSKTMMMSPLYFSRQIKHFMQ